MRYSILLILALLVAPAGIRAEGPASPDGPSPQASQPATPPADDRHADYRIQPGDLVRVQIFQEPDLDREIRVSQEGQIFMPLIGSVEVKGLALRAAEEAIRALYDQKYLVNPQVNMVVVKYRTRTVNVIGAVNSAQALEIPPEQTLTLLDAISRAGGFNRYANRKAVKVTRTYPDGRIENFIVNADNLITGNKGDRWVLMSDDVVFVPESIL